MFRLPVLAAAAGAGASSQPHLVFMVLDDIGWSDVSYHGSDFPTPRIDELATTGVRLEKYYVQQVCSPTRSALMTGRYPFRTGMQHCTTLAPGSEAHIPEDVPTLAEALKGAGYSTAMIGKWHLGYASWDFTPTGRGFDSHAGYFQGEVDYFKKTFDRPGMAAATGLDFWRNRTVARDAVGTHSMDFYMAEAERLLDERDPSKPLFLYFAHQQIHTPLEAPPGEEYEAACKSVTASKWRNIVCRMANSLDSAVGNFVDMLKARGMWEDTLLWVTTDNGGMTSFRDPSTPPASAASNWPLRGGKTTLFEGGVRGISFVAGGRLPVSASGRIVNDLLQHVDVPVTLAALGNATFSEADGFNVWDVVSRGAASPRSEIPVNVDPSSCMTAHGSSLDALISGRWKLISGSAGNYDGWWNNTDYIHENVSAASEAAIVDEVKVWLFDLDEDPHERQNIALSNPDIVAKMQARLQELADINQGFAEPQDNSVKIKSAPMFHKGVWAPFLNSENEIEV
jgi:arylsulfatase B/arylsulfatase I/J